MNARFFACMLSGLVAMPLNTSTAGGWAVITVQELPDYAITGRTFELVFMVRQHGVEPLAGLSPTIDFVNGAERRSVPAAAMGRKGEYRAAMQFPTAGEWTVTINSGFGPSRVTLLPIAAIEVAGALPALAEAERGRRLFVAKGCVTCHTHGDVAAERAWNVGPDLTGRRYPTDYLQQRLTDPKSVMPDSRMPNLGLRAGEIAALTAFINMERTSGS